MPPTVKGMIKELQGDVIHLQTLLASYVNKDPSGPTRAILLLKIKHIRTLLRSMASNIRRWDGVNDG